MEDIGNIGKYIPNEQIYIFGENLLGRINEQEAGLGYPGKRYSGRKKSIRVGFTIKERGLFGRKAVKVGHDPYFGEWHGRGEVVVFDGSLGEIVDRLVSELNEQGKVNYEVRWAFRPRPVTN